MSPEYNGSYDRFEAIKQVNSIPLVHNQYHGHKQLLLFPFDTKGMGNVPRVMGVEEPDK